MLVPSSPMARSRVSPSRSERWREHVTSDASYDGARYMVTVRGAKNLKREGFRGLTNPYCQVSMGRQGPFSTDVVLDSCNPSWEGKRQTFEFKSRGAREEKLSVTCFNDGDVPEVIGILKLALSPTDHKVITLPMFRKDRGGLQVWAGSMELELRYIPARDGSRASRAARVARMSGAIERSRELQGRLRGVSEPPPRACSRNPPLPETTIAPQTPMRATGSTVAEVETHHVVDAQPAQSRPTLVPLVSNGGEESTDCIEDEEGKDKASREPPNVRKSSGDDKSMEGPPQDTRHKQEKGQEVGNLPPVETARNAGNDDDHEDGAVKARGEGGSLFVEGLKGAQGRLHEPREARGQWSWKAFFTGVAFSVVLAFASLRALGGADARGCSTVAEPLAVELRVVCDGNDKARRRAVIMINGSVASRLTHEDTVVLLGGNEGWCLGGEVSGVSSSDVEGSPSLARACSVGVDPVSLSSGTLGQANSSLGRREEAEEDGISQAECESLELESISMNGLLGRTPPIFQDVAALNERVMWTQRLWRAASRWLGVDELLRALRTPRDTSGRGDAVQSDGVRVA